MKRLLWLDAVKAIAIFTVVYFHFYSTYFEHGTIPPADWHSALDVVRWYAEMAWVNISGLAYHAVGVFIILSGWALMESTARKAAAGQFGWGKWYRARFLRLYPMYWVAHIVYLVSPFVARLEPIDSRIILSLLGLRFVDISMNFYNLNAAWWYFSMLIQFYLIFPVLFWLVRRTGPGWFLLIGCAAGFLIRYYLLVVHPVSGDWIQGGLALCRLPEFALGMSLGVWHSRAPARIERFLLRGPGLIAGLVCYPAALQLYHGLLPYVFVDFFTGACCMLVMTGLAGIVILIPRVGETVAFAGAFSYGLYLIHQPYVIWLGLRIREVPIWAFFLIAAGTIAVLSAWGIILEKATNYAVSRAIPARKSITPPSGAP